MNSIAERQIALSVNQTGLMKGLKHAFSTKTTLFKELLQNGDRAGATEIRIDVEEEEEDRTCLKVVIEDNGCGIQDMGLLLSVAESGWSDEVMAERLPYGLGFLSALYMTRAIEVESCGFKMSFESNDALSFRPVLVEQHPESGNKPGTHLVLHGLKLKAVEANSAIEAFAKGFPVRVVRNGEVCEREHALDVSDRNFNKTDIGMISIPGIETGNVHARTVYYLQGFKVHSSSTCFYEGKDAIVVHLDPAKFVARMPDREVLIDEADRVREIEKVIDNLWLESLISKKAEMPAAEFIDFYWNAITHFAKETLDNIPLLPRQAVDRFTEMPFLAPEWESYSAKPDQHISMDDVVSGRVLLVDLDDMSDDGAAAVWNYAWAKKTLVINICSFSPNHWARPYVIRVDVEKTEVNVHGQYAEGVINGSYVWGNAVVLCESVDIRVHDDDGRRTDMATIDDEIIFDGARFLVPRKAAVSGWAVNQASGYIGENDRYMEDEKESDEDDLRRKIHELRGLPPADILQDLLDNRNISLRGYPSLANRSFVLKVDAEGVFTIAEQA